MRALLLFVTLTAAAQEPLTDRERTLLGRLEKLEQRVAALETQMAARAPAVRVAEAEPGAPAESVPVAPGTTINLYLDGYYAYNFNRPAGGVNSLRAYDVTSNSFNLNQAGLIIERAPEAKLGRRFGARLDLMFGQATETLQGSPVNEPRPQVFRHVFQAYGTYVAPIGRGLTLDFGKWASALGIENNYSKDQLNYSRSYFFNFLPFYHTGIRATYPLARRLTLSYWLANGLNQSEDFNGFKSQAILINGTPGRNLSWNLNYYCGREQRAWRASVDPGVPAQAGLSVQPVAGGTPRGRVHILDGYFTWRLNDRWTAAGEGDYVVSRVGANSSPQWVTGGAAYARYRFGPRFSLATRLAYLKDTRGLFSGLTQTLKDATLTANYDVAPGFQMRWEYRRDWSDVPFFLSSRLDHRKRDQNTALIGVIWWLGGKQGIW